MVPALLRVAHVSCVPVCLLVLQRFNQTVNSSVSTLRREIAPWECTSLATSSDCRISEHNHTRVTLRMPRGLGPFVQLKLEVVLAYMTSQSAPLSFNYSAPVVTTVSPNPVDARGGEKLIIYGENLGLVGLGPRPVVHLNGTVSL
jgi:hypothetical protein